jgi:hypothetical protein
VPTSTKVEGKSEHKTINHLHTRRRTSKEFRLNANIGDFNMGDIILDLGSIKCITQEDMEMYGRTDIGIFICSAETS